MGLKTGVWEDKTKPMENEKWINDGQKAGDVDRRAPPEQGEATTSAEVVTLVVDMRKVVTFVIAAINCTEELQSKTKKILIIVDQAVKCLWIAGLTWENVQDDLNEIENQSSQESCIG